MKSLEERYLTATRRLASRTDHLEEMARWKEDLMSRIWRADIVLKLTGECLYNVEDLEAEVKAWNAVSASFKKHTGNGA